MKEFSQANTFLLIYIYIYIYILSDMPKSYLLQSIPVEKIVGLELELSKSLQKIILSTVKQPKKTKTKFSTYIYITCN